VETKETFTEFTRPHHWSVPRPIKFIPTFPPYFLKTCLLLLPVTAHVFQVFFWCSCHKTLHVYDFLFYHMRTTCYTEAIFLHFSVLIIFGYKCKLWGSLLCETFTGLLLLPPSLAQTGKIMVNLTSGRIGLLSGKPPIGVTDGDRCCHLQQFKETYRVDRKVCLSDTFLFGSQYFQIS
jgi:hypothetical protein